MRKIIILFSFILFSINFSTAQVCEKVDCDAIKNYVTIKIIEEYVKTDPNEKILKDSFKKNTIETPLSYSEFANVLSSNNFIQTKEKLGDVINSINISKDYREDEFATRLMDLVASKLNDKQKKNCNFEKLKTKLIADIDTYLDEKIADSVVDNETSTGKVSKNVVSNQTKNNQGEITDKQGFFSITNLNFLVLISLLLPLILFIYLIDIIKALKRSNETRKKEIKELERILNPNNTRSVSEFKMTNQEFENLLNKSSAFIEFHKAITDLQKQSSIIPQQAIVSVNQASNQVSIPTSNISNVFYMKFPVENYFSDNYKSLTKENTIYRFYPKPNKSEAEYEIHIEGVKIDEIISMVEKTIKTGCDEENNPTNNTRNIKTINKGIVSLEGDKWVIKRKALIRYE
jgi:hypothetical protein